MRRTLSAGLALLALAVVAAPAGADVNAILDDAADALTTSPRREQPEPSIAINPRNTQVIAAGAQDFRKALELEVACGGDRWNGLYHRASDAGAFANELVPGYCTDTSPDAAESDMTGLSTNTDPVLAFDEFGQLFYSHIAFNNDPKRTTPPSASGSLYVSTYDVSDAGAFSHRVTARVRASSGASPDRFETGPGFSNFDDKQWMTVDNADGSPFYGRVYTTWTRFGSQGGQSSIWITHCGGDGPGARACDGESWESGELVNRPVAGGLVQESFPATGPNGELYVAFLQFQGGFGATLPHSGIWVAKSTDGGETFTQRMVADIAQIPSPIPPTGSPNTANNGFNSFRTGTTPTIGVTDDGKVHLAWGQWNGSDADVVYVRSTDGGATWSGQRVAPDVATGHQFFPSLDTDGNSVHVAWFDSRLDGGGPIEALDVFYETSADAGATFAADARVTDQSFNPNLVSRFPVFCQAFIGDYLDLDAVGGRVAVVWNDNRQVSSPLSPTECRTFLADSTNPSHQARLNDGSLDLEAFVDVAPF